MAEKTSESKCRKKDLVSLIWPVNTCCSTLIRGLPKGVTVDVAAGTWTFNGTTQLIGSRIYPCLAWIDYPIGVYDRTKMKHLEAMKMDIEWVQTRNAPPGD